MLASELAHGKSRLPFLDDAWRAITKIRSQLPSAVRDGVAEIGEHVRVEGARVSPQAGNDRSFELIRRAIADKRKVRCVYAAGRTAGKGFLFRPYTLYFGQRAWYAIGLHEERNEERSLKLNRLRSIEPTDRPYMIPDGWTIERCFGKAWRMMKGDTLFRVEIRFGPECAMNVADTLWHPTQTVAVQADGSCVFRCEVEGLDEIVWWVLGYGPNAEVVAPDELRQRIRVMVAELMTIYGAGKAGGAT